MNERATAMGLSVLAGLLFIVSVPKLINGLLQLGTPGGIAAANYTIGQTLWYALLVVFGIFCLQKARRYWKRVREKEMEDVNEEDRREKDDQVF